MNETTNEQEVLLLRRKLDLLLRTGKLLMESAADTNRISICSFSSGMPR